MPEDDTVVADTPADMLAQDRARREQGILEASQTLERIARQAARRENPSLAETEMDLGEAKVYLNIHQLSKAKKTIKRAERTLEELEDFKKAITDWSAVKHEQSLDFSQHTPPAMTKQDHVEIDQAYQRTKYKSA